MAAIDEQQAAAPLYERLGGGAKLRTMVGDIVDAHLANPRIKVRFAAFDRDTMVEQAYLFFGAATGGPEVYAGRGLVGTHKGMNVSEAEFVSATEDVLAVLRNHNVGPQEQMEVLAAFFMWKDEVLHL